MKWFKTLLCIVSLGLSASAFAVSDDNYMLYTEALRDGNLKFVKKLMATGEAKVEDKFFAWTALQIAANAGQLETVKYFVEQGADLNYQHPISKNTALHLAALNNYPEIVKYLIEKGADKNIKLKAGVSIIRPIKESGNQAMVDLLTSLGVSAEGCQGECFD